MTFLRSFAVTSAALILSAGASATAIAKSEQIGTLSITDPWIRATPPKAQTAGGFLTIMNSGDKPDRLVDATSPIAGRVAIHEMRMDNGVMVMRPAQEGIEIPAGGTVTLAPGGFHIMFMQLRENLVEGETIPVELRFKDAGRIEVPFPVEAIGAPGPSTASGQDDNMHGMPGHGHGQNQ